MKIVHVLPQFPYLGERRIVGGYPSVVLNLADRQHKDQHDVWIMARTLPDSPAATRTGVPIVSLGDARRAGSLLGTVGFIVRSSWSLLRRRGEVDVVHVHAGHVDYLLLAQLLRLAGGSRTVATFYCPAATEPRRRRLQRLIARVCGRSVRISGMSENVVESIRGLDASLNCRHTPPMIETDWWEADMPDLPERTGRPLRVLFVGNASASKGLDVLFGAVAEARTRGLDVTLTVTTELDRTSPEARVGQLRELASDLGLDGHVRYLGIVDDMRTLIRQHDVHAAPFRTTQGPSDYFVSTLEAMAAGTCVVASQLPGMTEVVRHGIDGLLVRPGDPIDLADKLMEASDAQTRQTLSVAAQASMSDGAMTPKRSALKFEDLYDAP